MSAGRDEEALLAAYLDGVSELTSDERRRVEARLAEDPALRDDADATRALLGRLRELAPEGGEPDWRAMARAISDEVGPRVPRRWWQSKRLAWLAPAGALVLAAAVLALVLRAPDPAARVPVVPDAGVARTETAAPPVEQDTLALWLDGTEVEVDVDDVEPLPEVELDVQLDVENAAEPAVDLMTAGDLAWVDELGEDDIAAAEAWLARQKS